MGSHIKNIFFFDATCDGTVGGSHSCMYNLIRVFDRDKYRISVGFYQDNLYVKKLRELDVPVVLFKREPVTAGPVPLRKLRNWYRLEYKHGTELINFFYENKIDLVILNNSVAVGLIFVRVCRKMNLPIIAYERGFGTYEPEHIRASGGLTASIAVSKSIMKNMTDQKFRSKHIRIIYDGLSNGRENGKNNVSDLKRKLGMAASDRVVGMVGNIRPWKGQECFVQAFLELGDKYSDLYGLVIGGCGKEDIDYFERLKVLAASRECGNRLLFLGYREDVADLFPIMNVFVHASIKPEPFGMVILEAMSHRVPVIATDSGGPAEILENGEYGILVPPNDEKAIVSGVERYLNDKQYRTDTIERSYNRIRNIFTIEATYREVEGLFQCIGVR